VSDDPLIVVRPVELGDTDAMRAWYAVMTAAEAERPLFLWPSFEVALRTWRLPRTDREDQFLLATVGGAPAGAGQLSLHHGDNEHLAHLTVLVDPAHRRQGVGTALLGALESVAVARGRDTFVSATAHPPGQPGAGAAFAAARGYPVAGVDVLKAADLASTAERWPALAERAAGPSAGYELVWWTDTAPEEHLESLAHLYSRFLAEIPLGDLDIQPKSWDPARIRADEDRHRQAGARPLLVAARAPDGRLAGYTTLSVDDGATFASIDSTLVLSEHRGHALGLAMKVKLHQLTAELMPEVTFIFTGNAGVNRWMNAVNDDLGYEAVEDDLEVQKKLDPTRGGNP
jgi:GNAT superfamily N-acetyltransferase